ncbi:hypothetical protein L484_016624 [Morus notabilis]|uniref:Aminotransferase-like plant mobile domain-containing protein n=1 Tax=Morus notabilis TaxID=981085 RepID=W9SB14_9ROSA|nr:hypothetical protein L484_016624 [Morus notabilis]
MNRDSQGLRHLLRRWKERDTFGAGWGEFSIGLDDVCVMFQLPAVGQTSLFNIKLDGEEKGILENLERGNTLCRTSKRLSFVAWTRFFFGDYDEKNTFVAGTCADWGCQVDALVALCLSSGFILETYISTAFLQAFLWERFPKYAPKPAEVQDIEKSFGDLRFLDMKIPAICCWFRREPTSVDLLSVLDVESEFCFRPFVMLPAEIRADNFFLAGGVDDFTSTQLLSHSIGGEPDQFMVEIWYDIFITTLPSFLPSFKEERGEVTTIPTASSDSLASTRSLALKGPNTYDEFWSWQLERIAIYYTLSFVMRESPVLERLRVMMKDPTSDAMKKQAQASCLHYSFEDENEVRIFRGPSEKRKATRVEEDSDEELIRKKSKVPQLKGSSSNNEPNHHINGLLNLFDNRTHM